MDHTNNTRLGSRGDRDTPPDEAQAHAERHEAHAYEVPRVKTGAIHREGQEPLGDDLDRADYADARS